MIITYIQRKTIKIKPMHTNLQLIEGASRSKENERIEKGKVPRT